jgi:drug/metabolite transporter (DMT)-like permease
VSKEPHDSDPAAPRAIQEVGASSGLSVVVSAAPRRSATLGYLLYLPAALLFSLNGTVSKQLLVGGVESTRLSQLRVTAAFLVLLAVVLLTRPRTVRLTRRELPVLLLYGIAGIAMTQWLYFVAIARLPIGIALLIEFTAPVMVALWVRFAWHRPVRDLVWVALGLSMLGLAMVGQVWKGFALDTIGVLAGFGAAAALAIYYLSGERAVRTRDTLSLNMWGMGAAALMWALVAPWWSFPWSSVTAVTGEIGPWTAIPGWVLVAYMVLLGTVVPFTLVLASLRYLSAAQASVVGMVEPVLASAIAWIVLGEMLSPVQVLGGAVILAGVLLAENSR